MIKAKVICDSKHWKTGKRVITFEVEMHRYILPENNTHKMVVKNGSSSRAVPLKSAIENILNDTAIPVEWGLNQAGMSSSVLATPDVAKQAEKIWLEARDSMIEYAKQLGDLNIHKQWSARLLEPFMYQKMVMTATDWDNFFWLRAHKDAQPDIRELAYAMLDAANNSTPMELYADEWHLPYINRIRDYEGILRYYDTSWNMMTLNNAIKVSASCVAQTSYRKTDDTIEKANLVFDRLSLTSTDPDARKHSSPVEHLCKTIEYGIFKNNKYLPCTWERGITHVRKGGVLSSGAFADFIQYRHLIPNESCKVHPDLKDGYE